MEQSIVVRKKNLKKDKLKPYYDKYYPKIKPYLDKFKRKFKKFKKSTTPTDIDSKPGFPPFRRPKKIPTKPVKDRRLDDVFKKLKDMTK